MRTYTGNIRNLESNQIFVFGSNTEGRHGKGAAKLAYKYFGALYGKAKGMQGKSYAICTKDLTKDIHPSIPKQDIIDQIDKLYGWAALDHFSEYLIAYTLATNLNGYTSQEMADMFAKAGPIPENIVFNDQFAKLIDTSLWASKTI